MKKNTLLFLFLFFLSFFELNATEFKGSFTQGNLIIGKTKLNNSVYIDKKK